MRRVILAVAWLSLACWGQNKLALENQGLRLELNSSDGSFRLTDKRTGAEWPILSPWFGEGWGDRDYFCIPNCLSTNA